ncbi:MAG: hypothetical protein CL833_05900 [Crocinitomicaceae bacterium]|nr:hypothetical protein [Crocinitomicaceae bacterium]|tara:strand:- start:1908 stop:2174 length:267 start_codon:yes stop_codon:yes gene_type:complete
MTQEPIPSTTNYPEAANTTSVDEVVFDEKGVKYKLHEYVRSGTGAPNFSADQGTLYIQTDGATATTRLYINTDGKNGPTSWANFTASS